MKWLIYMVLMVTTILLEILWWQSNLSFLSPIDRSGAKSKSSPTNGPSSFKYKYKYKHQSKCNVLHFTFFPYNTVYTCLACVARFDFFTNCFNAICLHKNLSEVLAAFQKEKAKNQHHTQKKTDAQQWAQQSDVAFFTQISFIWHWKGKVAARTTQQFQNGRYTNTFMMNDTTIYDCYLRKTHSEQTAFRWHRLNR